MEFNIEVDHLEMNEPTEEELGEINEMGIDGFESNNIFNN